ncbi:hypothetical protein [Microbispora catharanthi]|uniref:Uncharacterized protein n=1 Tax=Microbispora catharanthi TaxID=1712871 RepID=A0A5N6B2P7_9ACTN|nr:hypothetical protein [Microbispora catharanthi]KAB8174490.1 hypothetical protein FH610_040375 [Microbispora catharanthi]
MPSPVMGEAGCLLESRVGPQAEVTFLKSFGGSGFHVAELEDGDLPRMAEPVERYVDLPLGLVDAAVIAPLSGADRLRRHHSAAAADVAGRRGQDRLDVRGYLAG